MSRTFGLWLLAMAVAFAVTVVASEKPTKEYQEIMKSNGTIVDLSAGTISREVSGGAPVESTSLRVHMLAKDYDGIAKDATTLKANFAKVEIFWTQRRVEDAIRVSKVALKASTDLETAAKAKDDAGIVAAQRTIADACRSCHLAHRVIMLADGTFEIA